MEAKIKAALKAVGLDESLYVLITATEEADIDKQVKVLQGHVDKRVKQAIETNDTKHSAKIAELEGKLVDKTVQGGDDDKNKQKGGDGMNTPENLKDLIMSAVAEATKPLQDEINNIKTAKITDTHAVKVSRMLKDAGMSEAYAKYVSVTPEDTEDTEDTLKAKVESVKADFAAKKQDEINQQLKDQKPLIGINDPKGVPEAELKDFTKRRSKYAIKTDK